jgi:hypothetical protein
MTCSTGLKNTQEILPGGSLLGNSATRETNDLSDLFASGVISTHVCGGH